MSNKSDFSSLGKIDIFLQIMMETRFFTPLWLAGFLGSASLAFTPGLSQAQTQAQPSMTPTTSSSVIVTLNQEASQGKRLATGKPRIATKPEAEVRLPVVAKAPVGKVLIAKAQPTPVKVVTPTVAAVPAATSKPLAARGGATPPAVTAPETASTANQERERILLAQLDADLQRTEKRLDTTNEKLSKGQQELLSLSSTLRTVMDEFGAEGEGLHPFVRVASRYAGTPYVWGGESRYGFDCSGFIIRVMRDLGYKALPHSAAEQFKYGSPVAQSLLKPGDIVFFANTYKPGISHVGIYIGKRRFIHAASTREGTIVSSLDASPYKQKYAGARRLAVVR